MNAPVKGIYGKPIQDTFQANLLCGTHSADILYHDLHNQPWPFLYGVMVVDMFGGRRLFKAPCR